MQQRQVTGIWSGKDELPVSYNIMQCVTYCILQFVIIILIVNPLINLEFILV